MMISNSVKSIMGFLKLNYYECFTEICSKILETLLHLSEADSKADNTSLYF